MAKLCRAASHSVSAEAITVSSESPRRSVYAQDDIEHVEADGTRWPYDCVGHSGPPIVLQRLLYKKVVSVDREDLCLTLRLEDGSSLAFHSELGPYESGHILSPEGDFTVY